MDGVSVPLDSESCAGDLQVRVFTLEVAHLPKRMVSTSLMAAARVITITNDDETNYIPHYQEYATALTSKYCSLSATKMKETTNVVYRSLLSKELHTQAHNVRRRADRLLLISRCL
jgi:hypothetical protein